MTETELKQRFFAQYYGQFVLMLPNNDSIHRLIDWFKFENGVLRLKDLRNISDEDAIFVTGNALDGNKNRQSLIRHTKEYIKYYPVISLSAEKVDRLRSLGYLVEFMGLSIEDILNKGWARYE